jgi:hypothetical protein
LGPQAQGKDVRALRSLYHLAEAYISCGAAGTPTLYDPTLGESQGNSRLLCTLACLLLA